MAIDARAAHTLVHVKSTIEPKTTVPAFASIFVDGNAQIVRNTRIAFEAIASILARA